VKAKLNSGGHHGLAPDGYRNMKGQVVGEAKRITGRHHAWIELDPDRAPIIRLAWDLLLEDRYTLKEICEMLHERGYRYRSGRPFIQISKNGRRKANYNTLVAIFHNWAYAGWVTSKVNNIPPKTVKGGWEAIVTTEELERGLAILDKRNQKRTPNRKHDYLLRGLIYYRDVAAECEIRLTCSTTNASRANGGTSYYRIADRNVRFLCRDIDGQITQALNQIQVDPTHLPAIRATYNDDIAKSMGHLRPSERTKLESALKAGDVEEGRALRLFAAGKIIEFIWNDLWLEWQDRRNRLRCMLDAMQERRQIHIENLDSALRVISKVGLVYNGLSRNDKRELLRQMVERVIVDSSGNAKLELRTPFAYLHDISDQICSFGEGTEVTPKNKETAGNSDLSGLECSIQVLGSGEDRRPPSLGVRYSY
jgi:site-specific DNA recombinase